MYDPLAKPKDANREAMSRARESLVELARESCGRDATAARAYIDLIAEFDALDAKVRRQLDPPAPSSHSVRSIPTEIFGHLLPCRATN